MYDYTFFPRSGQLPPVRNAKEPGVAVLTADRYELAEHVYAQFCNSMMFPSGSVM